MPRAIIIPLHHYLNYTPCCSFLDSFSSLSFSFFNLSFAAGLTSSFFFPLRLLPHACLIISYWRRLPFSCILTFHYPSLSLLPFIFVSYSPPFLSFPIPCVSTFLLFFSCLVLPLFPLRSYWSNSLSFSPLFTNFHFLILPFFAFWLASVSICLTTVKDNPHF